ncbi:MAG TPA: sugar phosphate nucleotidyltransferase, partial [Desulfomonilaceae bacterium]|nr:sugar phosphate nucleotidyltransferase [Desulfomonilaceae bacterium]
TGPHPLLVMNGDLVTQANIGRMLEFHEAQECEATVGVSLYPLHIPFGVVRKEGTRLIELQEKPTEHFVINSGIYILNPSVLSLIPKDQEFPITSLIQTLLARNALVSAYLIEEEWIDVGRHEDLWKAKGII